MKQAIYGLILFIFLSLSPVRHLAESIMSIHMHMQMPLLAIAGMLMTPFLQKKFGSFFAKWNANGVPGIVLCLRSEEHTSELQSRGQLVCSLLPEKTKVR